MVKLKCPNKKCEYKWDYKGRSPFYASCPMCHRSVRIEKAMKEKEEVKALSIFGQKGPAVFTHAGPVCRLVIE